MSRTEMDLVIAAVDDAIDQAVDNEVLGDVVEDVFIPRNEVQLDWSIRRIRKSEDSIAALASARARRIEIINNEFDTRIEELKAEIAHIEDQIAAGLEDIGEKSLSSPSGRAYFQTRKSLLYPDPKEDPENYEKLLKLSKKIGVEPRVTISLDKTAFKKHVEYVHAKDGSLVPMVDGKKTPLLYAEEKTSLVISKL